MKNANKFKQAFGLYATEVWAMPEAEFLAWLNADAQSEIDRKWVDLVDRQAAIDAADRTDYLGLAVEDVKRVTDEVVKELKKLPSAQPERKTGWIPCSERLPEKYIGEWLCYTSHGEILILPYDTPGDGSKECVFYRWDDNGYFYQTYDVIAWMPLPEPYKGKDGRRGR